MLKYVWSKIPSGGGIKLGRQLSLAIVNFCASVLGKKIKKAIKGFFYFFPPHYIKTAQIFTSGAGSKTAYFYTSTGGSKFLDLRIVTGTIALIFLMGIPQALCEENPLAKIKKEMQVGGAPAPSITESSQALVCDLKTVGNVYRIQFNTLGGKECVIPIPFKEDFTKKSIFSFRIRGEKDVQNFQLGFETADHQTTIVGSIFEFLPYSVISSWRQTGIPIPLIKEKVGSLSPIQSFVVKFHEPSEGIIELKDLNLIPHHLGLESWEPVIFSLSDYALNNISEFKTIAVGHFGLEFGWKVAQVYKTASEKSFIELKKSPLQLTSAKPSIQNGVIKVADFNTGLENNLGGFFNEFQKLPSTAFVTLSPDSFRGKSGRSLKIMYDKKAKGFCGAWVHLFDFKKPPLERTYFDSTDVGYLSFWVRGEQGGEDGAIQLSDSAWEKTEDSVYYGKMSAYLKKGVTKDWQRVVVPLKKDFYKNINFKKLAGFTLNFREEGKGIMYVDDISFVTSPSRDMEEALDIEAVPAQDFKPFRKAMWLWHTERILKNKSAQKEFLKFCERHQIDLVFFQIQYQLEKKQDDHYVCVLKDEPLLRKFISNATKIKVDIHALDGFSRFALKPWHEKVYAQIRALIDYNRRVKSDEQFRGIHHDNEPYLIPSYWGLILEDVMLQYLELCEASQKLVKESGLSNFVFGVDIPFWYEEANFDFKVPVEVTWRGVKKPASYHIIDIIDNVGIMDYRTKAYGADGTLVHGRDEIYYANKVGKKVLIGIETYPLPHEIFAVFRNSYQAELTNLKEKIELNPRLLFMVVDQYQDLGILYFRRFREDLKDTPEKIAKEIFDLKIKQKRIVYRADIAVDVLSSKLSFAGMDKEYFIEIYEDTKNYFLHEPSFWGMAIHYYETYKELIE